MAASDKSAADKKMASMLKRKGIERVRGRCPICYRWVSMTPSAHISNNLYKHIALCR